MRPILLTITLVAILASADARAEASASAPDKAPTGAGAKVDPKHDVRMLENELRFRGHPDLLFRSYGVDAFRRKEYEYALKVFKRAAWYADKPSQGMIAEMYATGRGVAPDMALAYAWMDLAAERGYRDFVLHRERYWERMDEATPARAVQVGQEIYAEYGDDVAKPRFATELRRESKEMVGSRTGFANNVKITIPSLFGEQTFEASDLDKIDFWDAEAYWKLQDRMWKNPNPKVRVSGLEEVVTTPQAAKPGSGTAEPSAPPAP